MTPQDQVLHDKMRIAFSDAKEGMRVLQKNLRAFAWTRQIRQLEASGGAPKVSVQLSVARPDATCGNDCIYAPDDTQHKTPNKIVASYRMGDTHAAVKRGDAIIFALKNEDNEKSWYTYLLDIAPDGKVSRLYPKKYSNQDDALLKSKKGEDLIASRWMRLNDPGVETIKLIVSTEPIDVRLLENEEGYERKGDLKPLERLLKAAGRRRGDFEDIKVEDWGTLQDDHEVLAE